MDQGEHEAEDQEHDQPQQLRGALHLEHARAIEHHKTDHRYRGDDVRHAEAKVFTDRDQQRVEDAQRETCEKVLDRVDPEFLQHLNEEEDEEHQHDEHEAIFARPRVLLVFVYRLYQVHAEGALIDRFAAVPTELLWILAVQMQHSPVRGEAVFKYRGCVR